MSTTERCLIRAGHELEFDLEVSALLHYYDGILVRNGMACGKCDALTRNGMACGQCDALTRNVG